MRPLLCRVPVVVLAAALCACCSEPLVFADWTVPVPEGTRIVEYADATQSDRQGNRIELVEDLAIGARGNDDNYTFFRPMHVGVDSAGNMYVLDGGNSRIQMYDAQGNYVRTLGAEGSGPGEFRAGRGGFTQVRMSIAGDHVVDLLSNNVPDLDASDTDWPSHLGSISRLAVDGRGRLYVFAFEPPFSVSDEDVDVDVYAPDGERLFTGSMPRFRWSDAAGEFVYGWRTNDETEEQEPVRYRLVAPF